MFHGSSIAVSARASTSRSSVGMRRYRCLECPLFDEDCDLEDFHKCTGLSVENVLERVNAHLRVIHGCNEQQCRNRATRILSCIKEVDADDCVVLPAAVRKRPTMLDAAAGSKKQRTNADARASHDEFFVLFQDKTWQGPVCSKCNRDPPRHSGWKIARIFDNIDKAKHEASILNWAFGRDYDVAIVLGSDWEPLDDGKSKHIDYNKLC